MADPHLSATSKEWHLVSHHHHSAAAIHEEKQVEEWITKGSWSGAGKHVANWAEHKTLRVQDRELGSGSYGIVERVVFKGVVLARKHVKPKRGITLEKLREEANVMERLVHKHILKLVGTYTPRRNELCILLYPAAVCDLGEFLQDIDDIRTGTFADREDAYKRLHLLGLKDLGSINDLTSPGTHTAVGFLQQTMGCITEALCYVHGKEIRHRDLKPKNILLSPGRVYLADFGIARDVRESEDSITVGRCGTPNWIAPEVSDMQEHSMSSADIWSLGCIFLTITTLIYGQTLEQCEIITKERSWKVKYELLPEHLAELRAKAIAASLENHGEPTFNVKHIIDLIDSMLQFAPSARPTAREVNERLLEIGGLDQLYHLSCCHKTSSSIAAVINRKLRTVWDSHLSTSSKIAILEKENEEKQKRIMELEEMKKTWDTRVENERQRLGAQYQTLHAKEIELRKQLEEKLKSYEARGIRQQPRSQNRGRGRGFLHGPGGHPAPANPARNLNPTNTTIFPALSLITTNTNGIAHGNMPPPIRTPIRRGSRIPIPERPSTPFATRPTTPNNRPSYNREPGSKDSTLTSSAYSTFSRRSTGNTVESPASSVGSLGGESEVTIGSPNISFKKERSPTPEIKAAGSPKPNRATIAVAVPSVEVAAKAKDVQNPANASAQADKSREDALGNLNVPGIGTRRTLAGNATKRESWANMVARSASAIV